MDPIVVVAALGFATTLLSVWLTAHFQHRSNRAGRMLEARLAVYGACSDNLFEYSRASYNRAKSLLLDPSEDEDDGKRQEAYRWNAKARSAIGQVYILTGDDDLQVELSRARRDIGQFHEAATDSELQHRQGEVFSRINSALASARKHLMA